MSTRPVLRRPVESGQYTSAEFAAAAARARVRLSVGRMGQCWDNAVVESFFATIKNELLETGVWTTHAALTTAIFEYIEGLYNTRRRHSTLGYLSPAAYEATAAITKQVAAPPNNPVRQNQSPEGFM